LEICLGEQRAGKLYESSLRRDLIRKYVPMGSFHPEKMTLEGNGNQLVKSINRLKSLVIFGK
jgi:hypothetical protein